MPIVKLVAITINHAIETKIFIVATTKIAFSIEATLHEEKKETAGQEIA